MTVPEEVQLEVKASLGENTRITGFQPASGGCINNGGCISTSKGDFFIKWNSASRFPGMFKAEAAGLAKLSKVKCIKIPEVTGFGEMDAYGWILMEHINSGGRKPHYWEDMGHKLAALHRETAPDFGLDHNNYIGSLPQNNEPLTSWIEFLIARRFEPMVSLAIANGRADEKLAHDFEKLYGKLKGILVHEKPSLIHGDLWNGNLMIADDGSPVLIDPAVYYGNWEIDLAFTTLFGGFDERFYQSYQEEWPLEGGYHDRFKVYNLYPLLVHVNLFGASYLSHVRQILARYV